MIATVTLSPALDLYLDVPQIHFDSVLRATRERFAAGGKGLNVSRMLGILGVPTRAFMALGGGTGRDLSALAEAEGIEIDAIGAPGSTRVNVHLGDESKSRHIKVNMAGPVCGEDLAECTLEHLSGYREVLQAVALTGSLPPGMRPETYALMTRSISEWGVPVAVDTSGEALRRSVAARPALLKVNRVELAGLLGREIVTEDDLPITMRDLRAGGIATVCVSGGGNDAFLLDETGYWRCPVPGRSSQRPIGAGDCFLAGLMAGMAEGLNGGGALRRAVACGTAWAMAESPGDLTLDRVRELESTVEAVREAGP